MGIVPTEAQEGRILVAYLRLRGYRFTHIANETGGGAGARFQGIRNKQQGTSKGFPDYLVIKHNKLIAIELKRIKGSKTTPEQTAWLAALKECGVVVGLCKGAKEAIDLIEGV